MRIFNRTDTLLVCRSVLFVLIAGFVCFSEAQAQWTTVHKYGTDSSRRELAVRMLNHPRFGFYRWFAEYPVLYRVEHNNPATCVWFEDLRFTTAGRDANPFRYGLCSEKYAEDWHPFRLRDDGTSEPLD